MNATFLKHFNSISNPYIERCKKHELLDILLLAISAVLSGAEGWEDIEDFRHLKLDWLNRYGSFDAGIPKHDTIDRIICRLKADEIEHAFQSWISSLIETTGADIIAIDGKIVRRSFTTTDRKNALHTVSTWSCQQQLVVEQTVFDSKKNEITAIPELLTMLDIKTRTCKQLLINNSWLAKDYQWSEFKSNIKLTAQVHDKSTGKDTAETRWYISSLGLGAAEQALNALRSHWQVESMHWMLDMTFREDESIIRKKQGPLVFNVMRKI